MIAWLYPAAAVITLPSYKHSRVYFLAALEKTIFFQLYNRPPKSASWRQTDSKISLQDTLIKTLIRYMICNLQSII